MGWRLVGAGAATLAVLAGAAVTIAVTARHRPAGGPDGRDVLWRRIPDAFAAPPGATVSAVLLYPSADGCFSATGIVDAGIRRHVGFWVAAGACDTVRLEWPVEVPPTNPQITQRETVVDATDLDGNGTWLTVAAATAGDRAWGDTTLGGPAGGVSGRLREPPDGRGDVPVAAGAIHGQYAVVGRHGDEPTVYLSPSGSHWWDRPLPLPGTGPAEPLGVAGAPDVFRPERSAFDIGPGVVVGRAGGTAVIWSSADGGFTWQVRAHPEAAELTGVVHDGSAFVATGAGPGGDAVVLTSADGVTWQRDPRTVPAGARPFRSVYALRSPARPEFDLGGPPAPPPSVYAVSADGECATVWRRDPDAWVAEPLGCHGVPTSLAQLADGRVAAIGGTTLWLRTP
ncbi:hypothetical protein [Dactylosporangium sp. NPDC050588]|uniref:hypothetical protein n=1 Tax=Dactylosporangium sp. NPDC050588 TaxID=3157211 RepID=UPI0033DA2EBA